MNMEQCENTKHIRPFIFQNIQYVPKETYSDQLKNDTLTCQLKYDPDFQRWIFLYYNKIKNTTEYRNLYQNLRNRYKISPIQIVRQYKLA